MNIIVMISILGVKFGSIKSTVVQLDSEICTILLAPSVTQDLMLRYVAISHRGIIGWTTDIL